MGARYRNEFTERDTYIESHGFCISRVNDSMLAMDVQIVLRPEMTLISMYWWIRLSEILYGCSNQE